jgi:hypothetical protein
MSLVPMPTPPIGRPSSLDVFERNQELAEYIANTDFVPRSLRGNPPAILAAVLYGHEIGLDPMTSLSLVAVIDGRPSVAAEGLRGLILAAGHELWVEESTTTRATVAGRRRDGRTTSKVTWTIDDAKRARIAGKSNWQAYPRQMLKARATAELARDLFADVIRGLSATEELDAIVDVETGEVVDADPAQAKTTTTRRRRSRAASAPVTPVEPEPDPEPAEGQDAADTPAEVIDQLEREKAEESGPEPTPEPEPDTPSPGPGEPAPADPITEAQMRKMFALFGEKGVTDRDERHAYTESVIGRSIGSSRDLTSLEASRMIEALDALEARPTLPPDEQAFVDEAKERFDATEVPNEEGGTT